MKPTYILRLEFEDRSPLMLHSYKDNFSAAREGAVLIKHTANAKSVEIWKAGTLELVAKIESK